MRPHATYKIFSGAVMTGTNVLVSVIIDTWMIDASGCEFQWSGNPTGAFTIEASNQYDQINNPNPTFVPISGAFSPALTNPVAGASSPQLCAISGVVLTSFHYVRIRYVNASGSGVLDAWFNQAGSS
jgi:hypothetical protein